MNPVLNIIGNLLGGNDNQGSVGSAQANSANGANKMNWVMGIVNTLLGSGDPAQAIKSLSQTNPIVKDASDFVQQNGGDDKAAFYKLAEQKGVNPDEVLTTARRILNMFGSRK